MREAKRCRAKLISRPQILVLVAVAPAPVPVKVSVRRHCGLHGDVIPAIMLARVQSGLMVRQRRSRSTLLPCLGYRNYCTATGAARNRTSLFPHYLTQQNCRLDRSRDLEQCHKRKLWRRFRGSPAGKMTSRVARMRSLHFLSEIASLPSSTSKV